MKYIDERIIKYITERLFERILVGGLFMIFFAMHLVALSRLISDSEASTLFVTIGPIEFNVLVLIPLLILLYIFEPLIFDGGLERLSWNVV